MTMDHPISSIEAINRLEKDIEARLACRDEAVLLDDGQTIIEAAANRESAADFIIDVAPSTRA